MHRALLLLILTVPAAAQLNFLNSGHSVLDAHNCYPYEGQWTDRLQRALSTGRPVGIEQDLAWYRGASRRLSHGKNHRLRTSAPRLLL
jgi:hypothetical protein